MQLAAIMAESLAYLVGRGKAFYKSMPQNCAYN